MLEARHALRWLLVAGTVSLTFGVDMSSPGPFQVGWQKMMMKPPSGLEFDSIIIYPSTDVGWQAPPDTSNGPYPVLVFGHGYSTEPDSYMSTLQHLSSWGYIVAAPEVPALHHLRYANEMSTCYTHLEKLNADKHSPFNGLIDTKHYGIFGHTAGAGSAIVAAAKDPRIRCVLALAPVDTMPSSILTVKKVHVPINIIVAKDDWLASPDKNAVPIYKNAHAPKQFHILSGGGNAYFYDGEGVHRQRQLRITRFFLTTWFNLYLRQDVHMWPYVWGDNVWNDTVVFSVQDRGDPMELARRQSPTDSAIVELEEESHMQNPLTFDPRNPRTFQSEFSKPGAHKVGNTNVTTTDHEGKMFSAYIHYPAAEEGIGTQMDLDAAPYPIIVFAHGWFQVPESYTTTLQYLTSFGYVVISSRASQELFADKYAEELQSIINWIQVEATTNGSDWYQFVDPTRIGLMGHSIGGGVAILAAANDPRVKAIVTMAASQTHHPSSMDVLPQVHVPMCFICADDEEDGDMRLHSRPLFDRANYPKVLHQFTNGSNTFFSDGMLLGAQHRKQLKDTQELSRAYFDLYLKGDNKPGFETAWKAVWSPQALNISKVTHVINAGFSLLIAPGSAAVISSDRGNACEFVFLVNNTSPTSHVFDVFVDDNVWPVDCPSRTGRLRPRQTATFRAVMAVPPNTKRAVDRFIVSIRSDTDGFTRQALEVECNVPVQRVTIKAKQLPDIPGRLINATSNSTNNTSSSSSSNTRAKANNTNTNTSSNTMPKRAAVEVQKGSGASVANKTGVVNDVVHNTPGWSSEGNEADDVGDDESAPASVAPLKQQGDAVLEELSEDEGYADIAGNPIILDSEGLEPRAQGSD